MFTSLSIPTIRRVWTCFEYAMLQAPDLMRDRHLDQIIMCCIYVMAKVMRLDITFQEIMRQYRHQPQAKSHVSHSSQHTPATAPSVALCC